MEQDSPRYSCSHDLSCLPQHVLDANKASGCDFGCAPWVYLTGHSPHYGPPGSCKNHRYPTCPSQNPYTTIADEFAARGEEIPHWTRDESLSPDYGPYSSFLAPVNNSRVMKKRSSKTRKKRAERRRASLPKPNSFDMQGQAEALAANSAATGEVSQADMSEELVTLIGKLRVQAKGPRPPPTRKRRNRKGRKKGGRRTRK